MSSVLHDFIVANREQIIARAREHVRESRDTKLEDGLPIFLNQLIDALASIPEDEHWSITRCLDDAIAGAGTAHASQRERDLAHAHELRDLLGTAVLSFDAIRKGTVGVNGSTGAVLARSLSRLGALLERSLAEVRLDAEPLDQSH